MADLILCKTSDAAALTTGGANLLLGSSQLNITSAGNRSDHAYYVSQSAGTVTHMTYDEIVSLVGSCPVSVQGGLKITVGGSQWNSSTGVLSGLIGFAQKGYAITKGTSIMSSAYVYANTSMKVRMQPCWYSNSDTSNYVFTRTVGKGWQRLSGGPYSASASTTYNIGYTYIESNQTIATPSPTPYIIVVAPKVEVNSSTITDYREASSDTSTARYLRYLDLSSYGAKSTVPYNNTSQLVPKSYVSLKSDTTYKYKYTIGSGYLKYYTGSSWMSTANITSSSNYLSTSNSAIVTIHSDLIVLLFNWS